MGFVRESGSRSHLRHGSQFSELRRQGGKAGPALLFLGSSGLRETQSSPSFRLNTSGRIFIKPASLKGLNLSKN